MDKDNAISAEKAPRPNEVLSFTVEEIRNLARFYEVFIDIDRRLKSKIAKEKLNGK